MIGRLPASRRLPALLLVGALALALLALPALAKKKKDDRYLERFTAAAHSLAAGQTGRIELGISRWSTPEERETLLAAVKNTGREDFQRVLRREVEKLPLCGFFRFTSTLAVNIRYARQVAVEGGRRILLVAERPILPREAAAQTRSLEYALSIIELRLGEDDRGEGTLAVGVEIIFNEKTDSIELTSLAVQPVRLVNVRKR